MEREKKTKKKSEKLNLRKTDRKMGRKERR